jgi:glycerol kinase
MCLNVHEIYSKDAKVTMTNLISLKINTYSSCSKRSWLKKKVNDKEKNYTEYHITEKWERILHFFSRKCISYVS